MECLLAGRLLQRCRTHWLAQLCDVRHALMLGEGNGRFLVPFVEQFPTATVTCVDASARMLQCARARLTPSQCARVEFIHADALTWRPPHEQFDLVVTHFFLDCFRPGQLARLIGQVVSGTTATARWLLADFREPDRGWTRWRARLMLRVMYAFFRIATALPARRLTAPDFFLEQAGFTLKRRQIFEFGLLHSDVWEKGWRNPEEINA